jgi:hypothetical protein
VYMWQMILSGGQMTDDVEQKGYQTTRCIVVNGGQIITAQRTAELPSACTRQNTQKLLSPVPIDEFVPSLALEPNNLDLVHTTSTGSYFPGDKTVGARNTTDAQY